MTTLRAVRSPELHISPEDVALEAAWESLTRYALAQGNSEHAREVWPIVHTIKGWRRQEVVDVLERERMGRARGA